MNNGFSLIFPAFLIRARLVSMKNLTWILLPFVFCTISSLTAQPKEKAKVVKAINAPRPQYPDVARARRLSGLAEVELKVDFKTGLVVRTRLLKSTGHAILDNAALNACARWKFPRNSVERVVIPVEFSILDAR